MDGWKRTEENTSENHSKNGCIDKDGKNSTRYCETIEKREYFYVLKSAISIDPWSIHSNSNILSWEMPILTTITHILFAPSHFTWLMLLLFLHSYTFCFIHFSYWAHIRQHFVCSISAMQTKNPATTSEKIGTKSFLTRWYHYLLDSWLVLCFFFLFRISASIYVIVIIRNWIRGEILNIFFLQKTRIKPFFGGFLVL